MLAFLDSIVSSHRGMDFNRWNRLRFAVGTVYFAGETFYQDQRDKISRTFGREIDFRSIFYASNDGGAIGCFTRECSFNEHRVFSNLFRLELVDPDTGEVITEMNRPGVIYITALFKTLIPLIRYPSGDLGEYTEPEGGADRKFRILGRSNVAARAGYVTLYPQDVGQVLRMCGIDDGTLDISAVEWCSPADLEYNPRTGKLKIILDRRH